MFILKIKLKGTFIEVGKLIEKQQIIMTSVISVLKMVQTIYLGTQGLGIKR